MYTHRLTHTCMYTHRLTHTHKHSRTQTHTDLHSQTSIQTRKVDTHSFPHKVTYSLHTLTHTPTHLRCFPRGPQDSRLSAAARGLGAGLVLRQVARLIGALTDVATVPLQGRAQPVKQNHAGGAAHGSNSTSIPPTMATPFSRAAGALLPLIRVFLQQGTAPAAPPIPSAAPATRCTALAPANVEQRRWKQSAGARLPTDATAQECVKNRERERERKGERGRGRGEVGNEMRGRV